MSRGLGAFVGFCFGLLLSIAYDTSAQVSVLEGGRRHLSFVAVLLIAAISGAIGASVASRAVSVRKG